MNEWYKLWNNEPSDIELFESSDFLRFKDNYEEGEFCEWDKNK